MDEMKWEMQVQRQIRRENDEYLRRCREEEFVQAHSFVKNNVVGMLGHLSLVRKTVVSFWPIILYILIIGLALGLFILPCEINA